MARISIVLLLLTACGWSQPRSEFEVASVKPAPAGRGRAGLIGGPGTSSPGRISAESIDLKTLLMKAYGLETDQITGPGWLASEKYAIAASLPPGTTENEFRIMLQNLLTERFKLTFHHEPKEFSIYELTVAKGGPRLKSAAAKDPADTDSGEPGPATVVLDKEGCPIVRPGVTSGAGRFGPGVTCSRFNNTSMSELAKTLAPFVGMEDGSSFGTETVHVVDQTGLAGEFDITLKFHVTVRFPGQVQPADPDGVEGPNIFTALEQQLGLKLQKSRATLDRIVIDSASKIPTDN